jgi:hypothetical protein
VYAGNISEGAVSIDELSINIFPSVTFSASDIFVAEYIAKSSPTFKNISLLR